MLVSAFDFDLPAHLIAQHPRPRGASRLLVVDRAAGTWTESTMAALPSWLRVGDLLVANDTRVFPARLLGRRDPSGGAAECLLVERLDAEHWLALVHPGQKLKPGTRVVFDDAARAPGVVLTAEILERQFFGKRRIRLDAGAMPVDDAVDQLGHVPLPPYIRRPDTLEDRERYQTIFARTRGSIAAPTAGLHFDVALLTALAAQGIQRTAITLHVGYGTFKPVRVERVEDHQVDAERWEIGAASAREIAGARERSGRVIAIGTTTTRALEAASRETGEVTAGAASTDLFLSPGYTFRAVDALVTNFHLPRSSLLMLVSAFTGRELLLAAYRDAVTREFRFYSYGDAMLIL